MQLKQFEITGLFGYLNHSVPFPIPREEESSPSLVILHGRNGVGKTTILRMLDGLLSLDFNPFRTVPFDECFLELDSGDRLNVKLMQNPTRHLEVTFQDLCVRLHPKQPGALDFQSAEENERVSQFRQAFFRVTDDITFEFIDTERLYKRESDLDDQLIAQGRWEAVAGRLGTPRVRQANPKARTRDRARTLAERVRHFISEAQVNYRTYFSTTEPDLFPKILERLTSAVPPVYGIPDLRERLRRIHDGDKATARFGLEPDRWDYDQLLAQLGTLSRKRGAGHQQTLTVAGSYVELLESRAAARGLVADRLMTFERLMGSFFADKSVLVDPRLGIRVQNKLEELLEENQLSSGEFHLLFLMVAALVTRRRGTVIAIDEPEMSMHIAWQRKLIPALLECASNAQPLFIFATHSPDLAASYPDALIELGEKG